MVEAKSSNPIHQIDREKRMEEKVIMIEKSNSSHPINQESDCEKRMEEKVIMIENSNSSHPINQESDCEKRMEEKVIMIEKSNSSRPMNQKRYRSDEDSNNYSIRPCFEDGWYHHFYHMGLYNWKSRQ
ncbi:hypothetical protein P8452_68314 [Trifolium repens]|nr:hypothetical protein P8452_68314 [Trifolium repens]